MSSFYIALAKHINGVILHLLKRDIHKQRLSTISVEEGVQKFVHMVDGHWSSFNFILKWVLKWKFKNKLNFKTPL